MPGTQAMERRQSFVAASEPRQDSVMRGCLWSEGLAGTTQTLSGFETPTKTDRQDWGGAGLTQQVLSPASVSLKGSSVFSSFPRTA